MHLRFFFLGIFIIIGAFTLVPPPTLAQETGEKELQDSFEPTPGPGEETPTPPAPKKSITAKDEEMMNPEDDAVVPSDVPPPAESENTSLTPKDDGIEAGKNTHLENPIGENKANKKCDCRLDPSIPYRERRPAITDIFGIEAGQYQPVNYTPQVGSQANNPGVFGSYYGGSSSPNIELIFGMKYNFFLGSIGAQIDGGFYTASNSADGATITVYPIMAGATYQMDTIFKEPYVVPYVTGGAYMNYYKESTGGISVNGNTGVGMYYALGLLFQLDWIDEEAHDSGYADFGIENTFLFLEARSFLPVTQDIVDFSTPLQLSGGLKFEF